MRAQAFISLGWTPTLALVEDGSRRVLQVVAWDGGTGTIPSVGLYLGPLGYVVDIADATDLAINNHEEYRVVLGAGTSLTVLQATHSLAKVRGVTVLDPSGYNVDISWRLVTWDVTIESNIDLTNSTLIIY